MAVIRFFSYALMLMCWCFLSQCTANSPPLDADDADGTIDIPQALLDSIAQKVNDPSSLVSLPAFATSLQTLYASNNGGSSGGRVFFDLVIKPQGSSLANVYIFGLDANTGVTDQPISLEIWTRDGTSQGFEQSVDGWTKVADAVGTGAGSDNPTRMYIDGDEPLRLQCDIDANPTGCTVGVALDFDNADHDYTNGNGDNQFYETPELELHAGSASNTGFDNPVTTVFHPRVWNGAIYYSTLPSCIVSVDGRHGCDPEDGLSHLSSASSCATAASNLGFAVEGGARINKGPGRIKRPYGCYWDIKRNRLQWNEDGDAELASQGPDNAFRPNICACRDQATTTTTLEPGSTTTGEPGSTTTLEPGSTTTTAPGSTTTMEPGSTTTTEVVTTTTPEPAPKWIESMTGCAGPAFEISIILQCQEAAAFFEKNDVEATVNRGPSKTRRPIYCYYDNVRDKLQFNPAGQRMTSSLFPQLCKNPDFAGW